MSTTEVTTATTDERLEGNWSFAPHHSSANFSIRHLVATFSGGFDKLEGELSEGRLSGRVLVDSIRVKDENLAAHLKSPEFFAAEQYPELSFSSSQLRIEGDRVELEGELTIKGTTQPISAEGTVRGPIEDQDGTERLGFVLETTIDRTAYGVNWNADLPRGGKALSNDVKLTVELEFNRNS